MTTQPMRRSRRAVPGLLLGLVLLAQPAAALAAAAAPDCAAQNRCAAQPADASAAADHAPPSQGKDDAAPPRAVVGDGWG